MSNITSIKTLFEKLNEKLAASNKRLEIGLLDKRAIYLVYDVNIKTKDVDAIFTPTDAIKKIILEIAEEVRITEDWLDNAVNNRNPALHPQKEQIVALSNLKIWSPEPEYLFAMKAIAARDNAKDNDDLSFLRNKAKIKTLDLATEIVRKYYPKGILSVKTTRILESIYTSKQK